MPKGEYSQSRAAKQLGDFGEGLVTYALICKGYEVALVDHVGADLIAEKNGIRFAVSVQTRRFKPAVKESRVYTVEEPHLRKLDYFARQFAMTPLFAFVACMADDKAIHLFLARVDDIRKHLPKGKHGYSIRFGKTRLQKLIDNPYIDYSCWTNETIGPSDFRVDETHASQSENEVTGYLRRLIREGAVIELPDGMTLTLADARWLKKPNRLMWCALWPEHQGHVHELRYTRTEVIATRGQITLHNDAELLATIKPYQQGTLPLNEVSEALVNWKAIEHQYQYPEPWPQEC